MQRVNLSQNIFELISEEPHFDEDKKLDWILRVCKIESLTKLIDNYGEYPIRVL